MAMATQIACMLASSRDIPNSDAAFPFSELPAQEAQCRQENQTSVSAQLCKQPRYGPTAIAGPQ
jgi:hypothetical protein